MLLALGAEGKQAPWEPNPKSESLARVRAGSDIHVVYLLVTCKLSYTSPSSTVVSSPLGPEPC